MIKRSLTGLAMIRIDLGITQQQLAETLGISRSAIAMGERGSRRMPERVQEYLHKLLPIAQQLPLPLPPSRRKRKSIAHLRPAYNRIGFSTRKTNTPVEHISTLFHLKSVLSREEVKETGERLRDRLLLEGNNHPQPADANKELLRTLAHKKELIQCEIGVKELDLAAARTRASELYCLLKIARGNLKLYRAFSRRSAESKKKYRAKVARLFLRKIQLEDQLAKFNRKAIGRRKEMIEALRGQLEGVRGMEGRLGMR